MYSVCLTSCLQPLMMKTVRPELSLLLEGLRQYVERRPDPEIEKAFSSLTNLYQKLRK